MIRRILPMAVLATAITMNANAQDQKTARNFKYH